MVKRLSTELLLLLVLLPGHLKAKPHVDKHCMRVSVKLFYKHVMATRPSVAKTMPRLQNIIRSPREQPIRAFLQAIYEHEALSNTSFLPSLIRVKSEPPTVLGLHHFSRSSLQDYAEFSKLGSVSPRLLLRRVIRSGIYLESHSLQPGEIILFVAFCSCAFYITRWEFVSGGRRKTIVVLRIEICSDQQRWKKDTGLPASARVLLFFSFVQRGKGQRIRPVLRGISLLASTSASSSFGVLSPPILCLISSLSVVRIWRKSYFPFAAFAPPLLLEGEQWLEDKRELCWISAIGREENREKVLDDSETEVLIPGLPYEIAEQCLVHLPFPCQTLARSVSRSWKRAFSNPNFIISKKSLSLSLPYLFVHVFHKSTGHARWQAFDPRSGGWFPLPPMPGARKFCSPGSLATAALQREGRLFVLGGARSDTQSPLQTLSCYHAATNAWSSAPPMRTPRAFFAAANVGGRIVAAGGDPGASAECYDPAQNRWCGVAGMRSGIPRYDAAAVGSRLYITEGWSWPFTFAPRGAVYDAESDRWEEMPAGLCEGWTGAAVVLAGRLFVIREHGDRRLKVYESKTDTWREVAGEGLPREVRRPYTVTAAEGWIYAAGSGADVSVGKVAEDGRGGWRVEWVVVKGPAEFAEFAPSNCEVLYA
ncbi:hypothetical protein H6P81_000478 [Aristolochia fimbriata]|uniref:F-box domain-containing protein n=1 Tax=Aristolochia fimbriata TaxID=158543 RepID=A0AAV7F469_ARIFI|nr:hypothetical protein H6P81_000478 [Aristolochia fimbriata]